VLVLAPTLSAQNFAPPKAYKPDQEAQKAIAAKMRRLSNMIDVLRRNKVLDPWLAEVEVYFHAAEWIVQFNEFFQKESVEWTLEALDGGMLRAGLLMQGNFNPPPWLTAAGFAVVRAYRSRVDGSVQPYAVTFPQAYGKDPLKKWRVDVVLHGRDISLNEVKFLHRHNGDKNAPADQTFIQIDIYGRGNNAYRWAGEADVIEVLDHFLAVERGLGRISLVDQDRMVLRGFSMGGAGTWHLGLHYPDRWSVIGPGAGFTTTHGYIKSLPAELPAYQEACLHIYDAVDYAENAFNVPVVAYSGADDPQRQAAVNIEDRLKKLGIPMTHLVAPGLKHQFPPEWQKKAGALYAKYADKGREEYPAKIRFVTYTLRYPSCHWVTVLGLDRHYERAAVEADRTENGYTINTRNIRALQLTVPPGTPQTVTIKINQQEVTARPWLMPDSSSQIVLERKLVRGAAGQNDLATWTSVLPQRFLVQQARLRPKHHGLQGPIDDAFRDSFLCVRGTGKAWHKETQDYAAASLKRFQAEWAKFWRGNLPVKDDLDVNNDDIAGHNLILFGDPVSNSLIAQVLDGLPLGWTKDTIRFAGMKYAADKHVPVLIFPSPLNASRYVVLNTGHTFHAADYQGTNALLYPRLGDYAILRLTPGGADPLAVQVETAGLFSEFWTVPGK
jgi:dienelactone hydrolase